MRFTSLPRVFWIGNVYLCLYAVVAMIFTKERIFLDGSYYFFHVVQSEGFRIEHQRFILAASQFLTVAGARLHLSLNFLLLLNSLNPVVYLWILFLLSIFWLKEEGIAWALLLSSVCGIYFIYFCPMYEVWYGCVLLIFFAGILEKKFYVTISQQILFSLLLLTLLFSYPLIFMGVLYFSLSHFIRVKNIPKWVALIYASAFLAWGVCKYFFLSDYETGKIEYPLSQLGNTIRSNFLSFSNLKELIGFLFSTYVEEMLFLIVTIGYLLWRKEKVQAVLLLGFVVGFITLINLTQVQPRAHTNYFERMYLLLIPLCIVPFFRFVQKLVKQKIVIEVILLAIIAIRLYEIIDHSKKYMTHVTNLEEVIAKTKKGSDGSKFSIDYAIHPELKTLNEWTLPMESLIFSSLGDSSFSTTISWKADLENPEVASQLTVEKFRLRFDEIYLDDWLNQNYFHLASGEYKELTW